jgi:hypothetical protein
MKEFRQNRFKKEQGGDLGRRLGRIDLRRSREVIWEGG